MLIPSRFLLLLAALLMPLPVWAGIFEDITAAVVPARVAEVAAFLRGMVP